MTLLHPLQRSRETSREQWVRRTRESVARQMFRDGIPVSASYLLDNLDISNYSPSFGFYDTRTQREISAALTWLVKNGYATKEVYDKDDPPGQCYNLTEAGVLMAEESILYEDRHVQRRKLPY